MVFLIRFFGSNPSSFFSLLVSKCPPHMLAEIEISLFLSFRRTEFNTSSGYAFVISSTISLIGIVSDAKLYAGLGQSFSSAKEKALIASSRCTKVTSSPGSQIQE